MSWWDTQRGCFARCPSSCSERVAPFGELSEASAWLLVSARLGPCAWLLARLGRGLVPSFVVLSLVLALAAYLVPLAGSSLELGLSPLSLLREFAVGGCFALALALALLSASWVVRLSHPRGAALDPSGPLATAYGLAACQLVLSLGGLRAFVIGIAASFRDAPLALARWDARGFALGVAQLLADALASALGLAGPLLLALWLIELSLALVARAFSELAPAGPSPLRALLGLLAAALLLVPVVSQAPEATRAAIDAARQLTRTFAR